MTRIERKLTDIVDYLAHTYNLTVKNNDENVYELLDLEGPLFQLFLGYLEKSEKIHIVVSYFLDLNAVEAIKWHDILKKTDPKIFVTECYYHDDDGDAYMGSDAELLRKYKLEQAILWEWGSDKEDAVKFAKKKIVGKNKPKADASIIEREAAIANFMELKNAKKYH